VNSTAAIEFFKKHALELALLAGAIWMVSHWNGIRRQLADARQQAEAARLALEKQIVAVEDSKKQLQGSVDDLLRQAANEAAQAAPGAAPVASATLATAPTRVARPSVAAGPPEAPPAPGEAPSSTTGPECALRGGDLASVSVEAVALRAQYGSLLMVGVASVWREDPPPRYLLFRAKFASEASRVAEIAAPPPLRWGLGLGGICGFSGCSAGPVLAFPPARVLGFQLEGSGALYLGGAGAMGGGQAILRW